MDVEECVVPAHVAAHYIKLAMQILQDASCLARVSTHAATPTRARGIFTNPIAHG